MFNGACMNENVLSHSRATLADMFLVGVYGFIFVSFMVSILLLKLHRKKMFETAEIFYRWGYTQSICTVLLDSGGND